MLSTWARARVCAFACPGVPGALSLPLAPAMLPSHLPRTWLPTPQAGADMGSGTSDRQEHFSPRSNQACQANLKMWALPRTYNLEASPPNDMLSFRSDPSPSTDSWVHY